MMCSERDYFSLELQSWLLADRHPLYADQLLPFLVKFCENLAVQESLSFRQLEGLSASLSATFMDCSLIIFGCLADVKLGVTRENDRVERLFAKAKDYFNPVNVLWQPIQAVAEIY